MIKKLEISSEAYEIIKNNSYARVVLTYYKMIKIHATLKEIVSNSTYISHSLLIKIDEDFNNKYGDAAFDFIKTDVGIRPKDEVYDLVASFVRDYFFKIKEL